MFLVLFQIPFSGTAQILEESPDTLQVILSDTARTQTIREAAESIRLIRGVPGMVYAVFSKDSIIDFAALGFRVFKSKQRIEKNDRFNIGTNTAAFTAYIAARLVDAGYIKWTTPLLKVFLPSVKHFLYTGQYVFRICSAAEPRAAIYVWK